MFDKANVGQNSEASRLASTLLAGVHGRSRDAQHEAAALGGCLSTAKNTNGYVSSQPCRGRPLCILNTEVLVRAMPTILKPTWRVTQIDLGRSQKQWQESGQNEIVEERGNKGFRRVLTRALTRVRPDIT